MSTRPATPRRCEATDAPARPISGEEFVQTVRAFLTQELPRGSRKSLSTSAARAYRELEGRRHLSVRTLRDALLVLPPTSKIRLARILLAGTDLHAALLPSGPSLLPSIVPAATSTFPLIGQVVEVAVLAESRGGVSREALVEIEDRVGRIASALGAVLTTARVSAGMELAAA